MGLHEFLAEKNIELTARLSKGAESIVFNVTIFSSLYRIRALEFGSKRQIKAETLN